MEFKKAIPYNVNIRPSDNDGFMVKIGCGRLAFASYKALLGFLESYFQDPKGTEKAYNDSCGETMVPEGGNRIAGRPAPNALRGAATDEALLDGDWSDDI